MNSLPSQLPLSALLLLVLGEAAFAQSADPVTAAQALGKARPAQKFQPDGLLVCEGEEFQVRAPGWLARPYGTNYYAATLANTFLSRQAYLSAPEQAERTVAELVVEVPAAGKYLALARYEAAYRFETQFRVQIEQNGKLALDRLYGARNNLKIWAFKEKLKTELKWAWGAGESVVWEGHDAAVQLQPGRATIRLIADKQPEPAAKRNVDLVMLTNRLDEVAERIEKENYLPLDGMLTQSGDVHLKVHNLSAKPVTITAAGNVGGIGTDHSPYWVHLRKWPKFGPLVVEPGKASDWVEIGSQIDTLSDGQLNLAATGEGLNYKLEFGVTGPAGQIDSVGTFAGTVPSLPLAYFGDTRYSRRVIHQADVLYELLDYPKKQPVVGKAPVRTPIYGYTFEPLAGDAKHAAAVAEFRRMFSLSGARGQAADLPGLTGPRGYIDVRGVPTAQLAEYCQKLGAEAQQIRLVSLGDEIGLPDPPAAMANDSFKAWLQSQGVTPASMGVAAAEVVYNPAEAIKAAKPGLYYWSRRYQYAYGIKAIKERTDILRKHLPSAAIGANFSPHHGGAEHAYLGETFKWVSCFREEGMTLPWGEDYIFQVPVGSQQMNNISLDLARAGNRGRPDRESMFYVMPHWPGNTPASWRRMFFGALQHGATMINLFEFRPVQVSYTENHCSLPEMYGTVLRSFRELGTFEDIVQDGQRRPGVAGLWFSETGDIWHDNAGSFAAGKRALYTAIIHQQLALDFVVEQDAGDGTLNRYQALYLADRHVSRAASKKIAEWVAAGGVLLATAGAGMFDEYNQPNTVLRELLGVEQIALDEPAGKQIDYIKQDLAFSDPIDTVNWLKNTNAFEIPVIGVRCRVKLAAGVEMLAAFTDGTPAITKRHVDKGQAISCGFLPGLSYYKPAIPMRPVDRTSGEDSLTHFIPSNFDKGANRLIALPAEAIVRPREASHPLVETAAIDAPQGTAVVLVNWTGQPLKEYFLFLPLPLPGEKIALASGRQFTRVDEPGQARFRFDLDAADALIIRK